MRALVLTGILALAACKPPPTDADILRDMPEAEPTFASEPMPSPDTEGAMWVPSPLDEARIIYGIPGQPALVALECLRDESPVARLRITRLAAADEGAGALLAMVGNGHIGRVAVDATEVGGRNVWRGEALASDLVWEPLGGPRALTLTVPGAGMVEINPSTLPGRFVEACRTGDEIGEAPEDGPEFEAESELAPVP